VGTLVRFKKLLETGQVQGNPSAYLMRMLRNRTQVGRGDSKRPWGHHRHTGVYPSAGGASPTSVHRPRRPFYRCVLLPTMFTVSLFARAQKVMAGYVPCRHAPLAQQWPVRRERRAGPALERFRLSDPCPFLLLTAEMSGVGAADGEVLGRTGWPWAMAGVVCIRERRGSTEQDECWASLIMMARLRSPVHTTRTLP
jgi:hypothetical protein